VILQIINVLIGLSVVYLIFSTIASALFELAEGQFKQRGKLLERGIHEILRKVGFEDAVDEAAADALVKQFYESPVIHPLFEGDHLKGSDRLPSYIPPERFTAAILLLAQQAQIAGVANAFSRLKDLAETLVGNRGLAAGESFAKRVEQELTQHFNDSMDRVSGWFGRYARRLLLLIGLLLALGANVDTIQIVQALSLDPAMADKIADAATAQFKEMQADLVTPASSAEDADAVVDKQIELVKSQVGIARVLGLPIGWTRKDFAVSLQAPHPYLAFCGSVLEKLLGVLITAIALSFGAPFWYGLLNQLVSLRSSLKPGDKPKSAVPDSAAATPTDAEHPNG